MIYAGIVIYNKKCCDSISLQTLQKYGDLKSFEIIVYDNSTHDFGNEKYCKERAYRYITLKRNMGLSYAYNQIIKSININEDDYLLILDDDTELTKEYLSEITHGGLEDINIPIVRSKQDGHIFSPSIIKNKVRSLAVESINGLKGKRITAINSGMVIRTSVFKNLRYNENLFLDYVDHDFMEQVNANGYRIKILTSLILQDVARQHIKNNESTKARLKIYGKDYRFFCVERGKYVFFLVSFLKTTIKYCIQAKSFAFLKIYFECI